jgi:hypothetical protein
MKTIDRRSVIRSVMGGTIVAGAGIGLGLTLMPNVVEATPLAMDKSLPARTDDLVENAQWRRRRRWVCWWHRGRRVCGWRWVRW